MKAQPIGNQYSSVSFRDIYQSKECEYSEKQNKIINNIILKLQDTSPDFNGSTVEAFYKQQNGIDFSIESYNFPQDAVYLEGLKGVKKTGTGTEEVITWQDRFKIGIYDEANPFKVDDIETAIKDKNLQSFGFLLPTITVIMAFLGIIGLGIAQCSSKTQKQVKPLIENVNTHINQVIK